MADTDLTITGKDVQILIMLNGVPVGIVDAVVMFTVQKVIDTIEQKHLGTTKVNVDTEHAGYKGELEISNRDGAIDTMLDAMEAAAELRVPYKFSIRSVARYRNGTARPYTYPDCKITDASMSATRAEASTHRLSWRTGEKRIAG